MRQNFSVGIRAKVGITVLDQLLLERLVILDHAIVNERDLAAGIEMRMRVFVVYFAVRSPTRVADADVTRGGFASDQFGKRRDASGAFARFKLIVAINDGDSGGVVAAVFESTQSLEQDRRGLSAPDITDDSAHIEM